MNMPNSSPLTSLLFWPQSCSQQESTPYEYRSTLYFHAVNSAKFIICDFSSKEIEACSEIEISGLIVRLQACASCSSNNSSTHFATIDIDIKVSITMSATGPFCLTHVGRHGNLQFDLELLRYLHTSGRCFRMKLQ